MANKPNRLSSLDRQLIIIGATAAGAFILAAATFAMLAAHILLGW